MQAPPRWLAKPQPLARRCVFVREQAPLLLTEVFLDLSSSNPTDATTQTAEAP